MKVILTPIVLVLLVFGQQLWAHGQAENHSHSVTGKEKPHNDLYQELVDNPVYPVHPDVIADPVSPKDVGYENYLRTMRENIDPNDHSGRLFVNRIEGQYLKLKKGQVIITIDDGPTTRNGGRSVTPAIIDLLDAHNIRGLFFVVGNRVGRHKSVMNQLKRSRHIIGNHTYNHELDFKNSRAMYNSLTKANSVVAPYRSAGSRCYVRTPGGVWNNWRKTNLNKHSKLKKCIGPFYWNIGGGKGTADWNCWARGKSAERCAQGYYKELLRKGRGIILMHDLNKKSAEFLKRLLNKMKREGIKNQSGSGFWNFMDVDKMRVLDKLES